MTPLQKYRAILRDIELLLQERAFRYFTTRYDGQESSVMQVQCDAMMVLLKQWLEPHVLWFEEYDTLSSVREKVLMVDLDPEVIEARGDDAHN